MSEFQTIRIINDMRALPTAADAPILSATERDAERDAYEQHRQRAQQAQLSALEQKRKQAKTAAQ